MKKLLALAISAVAAFALTPRAEARVNRCTATDGTLVFTDQDCNLMGTTYGISEAYVARPAVRRPGTLQRDGIATRFGIGCAARSPEGLRSAVRVALDSGDPNQLAGLYDWNGASRGHAMDVMRRMQRLVARPAVAVELGADVFDRDAFDRGALHPMTPDDVVGVQAAAALPSIHVMRAHGEPGPSDAVRFDIVRDSGCLWLRF